MCFAILFCAFISLIFGCQSSDPVKVSGAVRQPGVYRYQKTWKMVDYIRASGGFATEADSAKTYVMRNAADSTGEIQNQKVLLSERVFPGETIMVPFRTYTVQFDSVYAIKDVRLETERVVFQIERGVLVPGRTEKGVMVAVLLGRGKTYEWPDTTVATTGFHYLYVHFHPDEYSRVFTFASGVVDSLEAIEDADAIHQFVFSSREYHADGDAMLPGEGYFSVYRGILFVPKNRAQPGDGMRKRLFDDGRIWTTYSDGRQRWQFPDGHVDVLFPNGQKEVRHRDGRVAFVDVQGNVRTVYPDGRETWTKVEGLVVHTPKKQVDVPHSPIRQKMRPQVKIVYTDTIVIRSYGGRYRKFANGRELWQRPDGSMVEKMPDGYMVQRSASGAMFEWFADGRTVEVDRFGHRVETLPDGQRFLTLPSDYAYPGALRTDLAEVVDMPDQLIPNGELLVEGQVLSDEVLEVNVYAFMVPDGDVIQARLERKGDLFAARFRFKDAGHYRVQVQVRMPELKTRTVAHHAVRVGEPEDQENEVFALADYPGDEAAAQVLIDQINAARKRLKRGYVMPHPELMQVAQIRLEEMIAKGEVSHLSILGQTLGWHLKRRHMSISASENVANARFFEELHPHWMMSGGHRRTILSPNWTHAGAAVKEFGGSVWAVEVFGSF